MNTKMFLGILGDGMFRYSTQNKEVREGFNLKQVSKVLDQDMTVEKIEDKLKKTDRNSDKKD